MRHALKSHVRVLRNGKRLPPVVRTRSLHIKGVGTVHTGSGRFVIASGGRTKCDSGVRELCLDNSDWTILPGSHDFGPTGWDAANSKFVGAP